MGVSHNPEWNVGLRRTPAFWVVAVSGLLAGVVFMRRRDGDRLRWYRVVYWLAYRLGLAVWRRPTPPADLVALVEGPSALPAGRALDLGCGTGTDAIYLATHGWDVTGVDVVPKALATARGDATAAGVAPRFVEGDVTRLHDLGVGDGYALIVDFGCFHTLPEDRRPGYVAGVSEAAAAGATLLLYGFRRPPKAAPMHAGVTTDEVQQRFSLAGWELATADRMPPEALGAAVRRTADRFELWRYQLRRVP
ncbi:class I SAM-dependent methyltransferase [Mycolicibacterium gadium]|jgi:SAM-dependent methyltransferase|uniref:class I SAM-dependent methyltransferase n=1 Tax=Mycolicibacterium gadium TaxID=1794 RepID=UPI002FDCF958